MKSVFRLFKILVEVNFDEEIVWSLRAPQYIIAARKLRLENNLWQKMAAAEEQAADDKVKHDKHWEEIEKLLKNLSKTKPNDQEEGLRKMIDCIGEHYPMNPFDLAVSVLTKYSDKYSELCSVKCDDKKCQELHGYFLLVGGGLAYPTSPADLQRLSSLTKRVFSLALAPKPGKMPSEHLCETKKIVLENFLSVFEGHIKLHANNLMSNWESEEPQYVIAKTFLLDALSYSAGDVVHKHIVQKMLFECERAHEGFIKSLLLYLKANDEFREKRSDVLALLEAWQNSNASVYLANQEKEIKQCAQNAWESLLDSEGVSKDPAQKQKIEQALMSARGITEEEKSQLIDVLVLAWDGSLDQVDRCFGAMVAIMFNLHRRCANQPKTVCFTLCDIDMINQASAELQAKIISSLSLKDALNCVPEDLQMVLQDYYKCKSVDLHTTKFDSIGRIDFVLWFSVLIIKNALPKKELQQKSMPKSSKQKAAEPSSKLITINLDSKAEFNTYLAALKFVDAICEYAREKAMDINFENLCQNAGDVDRAATESVEAVSDTPLVFLKGTSAEAVQAETRHASEC